MKNTHIIIVIDGSKFKPMYEHIVADVNKLSNVSVVTDVVKNGFIKRNLKRRKVRALTKGKLDFFVRENNNLQFEIERISKSCDNIIVVFFNAAFQYNCYLEGTLKHYKRKFKNLKYVLLYLDVINSAVNYNANYLRERNLFDLVYSIDEKDAKAINAIKWNTIYSVDSRYKPINKVSDLYFCGGLKNRLELLKECARECIENGINYNMDIVVSREEGKKYRNLFNILPTHISYQEVLKKELQANCLLDITEEGQEALTLRPYEAVCYNRKLLTNNKSIFGFKFYDPRYMQYFERVEDIDWDWVKADTEIDYGYAGEFSPIHLLDDIIERLDKSLK